MFASTMQTPAITFSVLIGRVSTEDRAVIIETLSAMQAQTGGHSLEVIVVDRVNDPVTARIAGAFPQVRLERVPPTESLPAMRYRALQLAQGQFVIVTEDHCVPPRTWLADFAAALTRNAGAGAISGCVTNGVTTSAWHWATFLCEYAAFAPPIANGPASALAGMNIVYPRTLLSGLPAAILQQGFWERAAHRAIAAQGYALVQDHAVSIVHCKRFSIRLFIQQRYWYSRYYAGTRFDSRRLLWRYVSAAGSILIPPVMLIRLARSVGPKPRLRSAALRALPWLLVMYIVWAAGEAVGYLAGPGDALRRIE